MALFLSPSGLLKSIAAIILSISSNESVSGNFLTLFGASKSAAGSVVIISSIKQNLKKLRKPDTILACDAFVMPSSFIHFVNFSKSFNII